jgi:ATP-dependent exoDNAse (exonuclease V) beta subunit
VKYPYPELSTVVHNNQRWYDTPVGYYPSITTVLGTTAPEEMKQSLKKWQDALGPLAAEKSKAATTRGTNVHLLCERFLKGEELIQGEAISEADMSSFVALKTKLKNIDEVWGQEVALYSQELELAGRCDLIGVYKGLEVIIDFKTAGRVKGHKDIGEYKCQLAFYANAHNEMFGTHIEDGVILMVADTGFPMEFKVKLSEHMAELKKRAAFFWLGAVNSLA